MITALAVIMAVGVRAEPVAARDPKAVAEVRRGERKTANAAWWGFDPVNATAALQAAIRSGAATVIVPNLGKPWNVDPIFLESDQTLELERGVEIKARRGGFRGETDALLRLDDKENVVIKGYGAVLSMRKEDYRKVPYIKSEYRDALGIYGSTNIKVLGVTLSNSGGDGIYIGSGSRAYSKDVLIKDVVSENNYRQGMSVISVDGLLVEDSTFRGTEGTAPGAGIDFEPNRPSERLSGIRLKNCAFERNQSYGIWVYTGNLTAASMPVRIDVEGGRASANGAGALFVDSAKAKGSVSLSLVKLEGKRVLDLTEGFTVEIR